MEQQIARPYVNADKIKKTVKNDIERANSFYNLKIEPVLRCRLQIYEADRKYYKKRFPKISNDSDFVSFDFWSFVQWAIPAVMNAFFGSDDAVTIVGRNSEDVPRAEVLKALVNFQLMVQNKGFLLLWDWFCDAFIYNLGAIKVSWQRSEEWQEQQLDYVSADRLMMLQADQWCEILEVSQPDLFGMYNVRYRVGRLKDNKPVLEPVRVTDLRWSPEAQSIAQANFVAQKKTVTADHLRRQARSGVYDLDAVERAIKNENSGNLWTQFEIELNDELNLNPHEEETARNLFELYECYTKIDINGDGLLEDALITIVGDELLRVIENPFGRVPIFTLAPIRDPFRVLAPLAFSEIIGEIQTAKTALARQTLINAVLINYPQYFVDNTVIDVKDLQENRQYIKVAGDPRLAVVPVPQQPLSPYNMTLFEFLEGAMEQWTGRTRYNQGTDASSLNKTATGISLLQQASEQRIDYIVRVFAETGVGEVMRFLVELNQRYIDQSQVIRLQNQFLQVTPDDIKGEFDIDINTEAGVGKRKQNIQNLQYFISAIAPTGMQIGAVTPGEWAKAAKKLLQDSGIRDPESYVLDPEIIKQQFFTNLSLQMQANEMQAQQQAQQAQAQNGAVSM